MDLQSTLYFLCLMKENHQQMGKLLTYSKCTDLYNSCRMRSSDISLGDVMCEVWVHTEISDLWSLVSFKSEHSLYCRDLFWNFRGGMWKWGEKLQQRLGLVFTILWRFQRKSHLFSLLSTLDQLKPHHLQEQKIHYCLKVKLIPAYLWNDCYIITLNLNPKHQTLFKKWSDRCYSLINNLSLNSVSE